MNNILISPEASRDLSQIKHFISKELKKTDSARKTVDVTLKEIKFLQKFPKQGPSVQTLTSFSTDLKILLCGNHIAIYKIENGTVYVSRIVDARQDYLRVLFGDDYWEDNNTSASDNTDRIKLANSLFGIISGTETIEQAKPDCLRKI